jgi:hypothetical protein
MPVTAVASVPRERYTSVQKNERSMYIGLWFDMGFQEQLAENVRLGDDDRRSYRIF